MSTVLTIHVRITGAQVHYTMAMTASKVVDVNLSRIGPILPPCGHFRDHETYHLKQIEHERIPHVCVKIRSLRPYARNQAHHADIIITSFRTQVRKPLGCVSVKNVPLWTTDPIALQVLQASKILARILGFLVIHVSYSRVNSF